MMKWFLCVVVLLAACGKGSPDPSDDMGTTPADVGADQGLDAGSDSGAADAGADAAPDMAPACTVVFLGPDAEPFQTLDEYCLFSDPLAQTPSDGVLPFEPIAVLYADESLKARFVAVPPGESIQFDPDDRWTFPEGTILVKTFYFNDDARDPSLGRRLLETRLIIKRPDGWQVYIYVWNEEQTEATYDRLGEWIDVDRIDDDGVQLTSRYRVPNQNQCKNCHEQADAVVPLGPRAFQLNRDYDYGGSVGTRNQLEYWAEVGFLEGVPADLSTQFSLTDFTDPGGDLDARARSYLEVNCAHCHNPDGAADPSGLKLSVTVTDPALFGVCRRPVAAGAGSGGYFYDIVPGEPDQSIMVFRLSSTDPEVKMPELPTQTADDLGVQLVRSWITAMTPSGCPTP